MVNSREMLRHAVATVAYRGGKAVRDAPPAFAGFRAGPTSRPAGEILSHIGDLFDWALTQAKGVEAWHDSGVDGWEPTVDRFFRTLADFYMEQANKREEAPAEAKPETAEAKSRPRRRFAWR